MNWIVILLCLIDLMLCSLLLSRRNMYVKQEYTIYWLITISTFLTFVDPTFIGTLLFWKIFGTYALAMMIFVFSIFWLQKLDNRIGM